MMKLPTVLFVFVAVVSGNTKETDNDTYTSSYLADLWLEGADVLRMLWRDCSKKIADAKGVTDVKEYFPKFMKCMKRKALLALDRALDADVVPVAEDVHLVRYELVDRTGNVVRNQGNETSGSSWTDNEIDVKDWRELALRRLVALLKTHVIKVDFDGNTIIPEKAEFRHRRRHQMMTMMMFGIVSIGMVMVPMGFQFLAVLGGKALLLAKMALILASIQGLRKVDAWDGYDRGKIASSPVNYGFYPAYPYERYDRRSQNDRSEPAIIPGVAPPPMPRYNQWPVDINTKYDRSLGKMSDEQDPVVTEVERENVRPDKSLWLPEITKKVKESDEARLYPVYTETEPPSSVLTSLHAPDVPIDYTTSPGEVQADYSLDLPYNRIHFQSPATLVPP